MCAQRKMSNHGMERNHWLMVAPGSSVINVFIGTPTDISRTVLRTQIILVGIRVQLSALIGIPIYLFVLLGLQICI